MYGTALGLRTNGPQGAFDDLDDDVLTFHITAASQQFDSLVGNRGYVDPVATYGSGLELAVYKVATWTLMTASRGVNPADPAHAALAKNHDDALQWWRDIAKGNAGLGASATARLPVATIGIFGDVGSTGGNEPRGW